MDTLSNPEAGQVAGTHPTHIGGRSPAVFVDRNLRRIWNYRSVLRSPLFHPFRKVLQPLLRWAFTTHLFVYNAERPDFPIGLNLKPFTICMIVLSCLFLPLIFVLLLPLLLIVVPVALMIGLMGLVTTSAQTDADDTEHHGLVWHLMH